MFELEVVIAGCGLVLAVAVGLVAHEWTHALVLALARVEYTVSFAPGRTGGIVAALTSCPWAVVRPQPTGQEPPWIFRLAALAPLLLAVPVLVGIDTGAVTRESPITTAVAIGWLACAIPSPQDFSVAFYAHSVLESDRLETASVRDD